jgi:hypothetical protein
MGKLLGLEFGQQPDEFGVGGHSVNRFEDGDDALQPGDEAFEVSEGGAGHSPSSGCFGGSGLHVFKFDPRDFIGVVAAHVLAEHFLKFGAGELRESFASGLGLITQDLAELLAAHRHNPDHRKAVYLPALA